jgi:hypothetical protein
MRKFLLTPLIILTSFVAKSQNNGTSLYAPENTGRFVGFNANPILSQLIPFSTIPNNFQTPSVVWRNLKKGKGIEYGLGFNLSEDDESGFISVGYAKKARLHKNFHWSSSIGLMIAGHNESPSSPAGFFGLFNAFGVEYHINEIVSVAARAELLFGTGDIEGPVFELRAPRFILVYFRVPKK